MLSPLIRISAFFAKEIHEVLRQPRLILSLLLGPFLILLLFGLGYQAAAPNLNGILVIPDTLAQQTDTVAAMKVAANLTFHVVDITSDPNAALAQLKTRQVDIVEIIPADTQARLERGEAVPVEFHYSEINPLNETWLESLGYAQVNEMNKTLLVQSASDLQQEAKNNSNWVTTARQQLDALNDSLGDAELQKRQASIRQLRTLVGSMIANPLIGQVASTDGKSADVKQELIALAQDLDALDQAISNHTLSQQASHIATAQQGAAQLETLLQNFVRMSPQVIVSPLQPKYENEQGQTPNLTTFYAPAVLALILQHIAITLGALSLVRERLLGAVEMFRIAPVSTRQILFGKYLAYIAFLAVLGAVLTAAMFLIQVPFRGEVGALVALLALLIVASLGIGFLISIVSQSETQAVQLSMLVLLLSIFFGGFFLPLENFWLPIRTVSYLLPLTPGILGLQDIMLRGTAPALWIWGLLGGSVFVTFLLVNLFAGRQLQLSQNNT